MWGIPEISMFTAWTDLISDKIQKVWFGNKSKMGIEPEAEE